MESTIGSAVICLMRTSFWTVSGEKRWSKIPW